MSIPFFSLDLKAVDLINVVKDIFLPFNFNDKKKEFESLLKHRYPDRFITPLPSGRIGFFLTLKFLFNKNDEIIFSSMSFPLYIKIAKQLGLKVRLVDVSINDLNIDYTKVQNEINENTKGIVVTHLFGNPCEIIKIKEICEKKKLILIEDCAQSFNSKVNNVETGNFGDVGIVSASLLKIPTMLSGGFIVTKKKELHININDWLEKNLRKNLFLKTKLLTKVTLSILNSYPKIYSILSDKIFSFLKNHNPRVYRNILYSGMGMKDMKFDPVERPHLSKYQMSVGISQLKRCDEMNERRRDHSLFLEEKLKNNENIKIINDHKKDNWNHQYFVILIKDKFNEVYKKLFDSGVHVMDENVWDCTKYNFEIENKNVSFSITNKLDGSLLRIQNNSFLKKKQIEFIAEKIIDASK